jgi:hypothetical protein
VIQRFTLTARGAHTYLQTKEKTYVKTTAALLGVALAVGSLAYAEGAHAEMILKDRSHHARHSRIDPTTYIHPLHGRLNVGFGAWVYLPIVPDGFIPSLNDTFAIEVGGLADYHATSRLNVALDSEYVSTWWSFSPLGGVRWDFHLTDSFTVFGTVKGGFRIELPHHVRDRNGNMVVEDNVTYRNQTYIPHFDGDFGVGAYFHLGRSFALRLDLGYRNLIAVGVSFAL